MEASMFEAGAVDFSTSESAIDAEIRSDTGSGNGADAGPARRAEIGRDIHPDTYRAYSTSISKSVMHLVKDPDDTDDIVQEAWSRYLRLKDDHARIDNPQAFLRRIAVNLALDFLRHRDRTNIIFADIASSDNPEALENIPSLHTSIEDSLIYSLTFENIMSALRDLPARCSKAFVLNAIEGHTHVEVSQNMGMSVSTVEKYCRRALLSVQSQVPNIFALN